MRRAPMGPSASQPSSRDLDRHRCLHRRHRPGAVFSSRRWKCGGTHAWLPMHARRRAVSVCMRSCALVHVRAHPPGPHAGGSKIPHESVQSGWLRGGTEQLPRLATRSWRAHRPCQRTAQLRRFGDLSMPSPGSGLSASPDRKQQDEQEATPTQPTAGFARMRACVCACVRACVRAAAHSRASVRAHANPRCVRARVHAVRPLAK